MAARTTTRTPASSNTRRISFAKISEPFEVPKLLSLQTDSFDWLIGNEAWVAEASEGTQIPQERLLNLNAILIMTTMWIFAWASGKIRVLLSTAIGMVPTVSSCGASGLVREPSASSLICSSAPEMIPVSYP